MFGISAALTTPIGTNGCVVHSCLDKHIKTVLSEGCSSITLFGTTGEGASFSADTRLATVRAVVESGLAPDKLILTLHGSSAEEIIGQVTSAYEMGLRRFLLPPPIYFNSPSNAGLISWFVQILSRFENTSVQFILYHIPQVIGVDLPVDVVAQLKAKYPDLVLGVKDSSGSIENTRELLKLPDLEILVGDERLLALCVKLGASGAISGIANIFSRQLNQIVASGVSNPEIDQLVDTLLEYPVTPAIKAMVAHKYGDKKWRASAPPLAAIADNDYTALAKAYDLVGNS